MQYEVWGRSRETKRYEQIDTFPNEENKFYMVDQVDKNKYSEAMILQTEYQQESRLILYKEFEKPKTLIKRRK